MAKIIPNEGVKFPEEEDPMHMINFPPQHPLPPPPPRPIEAPQEAFPMPPHLRRERVRFELENNNLELHAAFMNPDTVSAVVPIILGAPEEIQVVVLQLLNLIRAKSSQHLQREKQPKRSDGQPTSRYKLEGKLNLNTTRWSNPILDSFALKLYQEVYINDCQYYLNVLRESPYEIAVISRLIAYLESLLNTSVKTNTETDGEPPQHPEDKAKVDEVS